MMKLVYGICCSTALLIAGACGTYEKDDPQGDDGKPSEAWLRIKPDVDQYCGNCHNGAQQQAFTEARWKSSTAKARVANDTMPPGGGLPAAVKDAMVSF